MFTLTFSTKNAAFDEGMATEIARILRDVARKVERGEEPGSVRDSNGNRIHPDEEPELLRHEPKGTLAVAGDDAQSIHLIEVPLS